jgi:hypothetical protein
VRSYQADPGDEVDIQDYVSEHATSPTAMVVESLHILNPPSWTWCWRR